MAFGIDGRWKTGREQYEVLQEAAGEVGNIDHGIEQEQL